MYYPYLRGKQYELIVLRELSGVLASAGIVPIIEPVKKNISALVKTAQELKEKGASFIIIVNPQHGEFKTDGAVIEKEIIGSVLRGYNNYFIAFLLSGKTRLSDVSSFFTRHSGQKVCLIHNHTVEFANDVRALLSRHSSGAINVFVEGATTKTYRQVFQGSGVSAVLVSDGFKNRPRNGDYPETESFSDLYSIYRQEGYAGFGDFLIVGDAYSETGGPAHVVAIHLTYPNDNVIWIKHFLSDSRSDLPVDPGGKFLEALGKLNVFITQKGLNTSACQEFGQLYQEQRYPGLGYVKKLSMKHHVELMAELIRG